MSDVQAIVVQLQEALGLAVTCGSITLNLNESKLQSVKTETHQRVIAAAKRDPYTRRLDNRGGSRQS